MFKKRIKISKVDFASSSSSHDFSIAANTKTSSYQSFKMRTFKFTELHVRKSKLPNVFSKKQNALSELVLFPRLLKFLKSNSSKTTWELCCGFGELQCVKIGSDECPVALSNVISIWEKTI